MGGRRQSLARLIEQAQRARQLQLASWQRDYAPTLARLERAYEDAVDVIVGAVGSFSNEATITDAAVGRLLDDIGRELDVLQGRIIPEAEQLQLLGAESGYRAGLANLQGVQFNRAALEAIQAGIDFTSRQAFIDRVAMYSPYHIDQITGIIRTGIAQGWNPRDVASLIEAYFRGEGLTPPALFDLERMTRTVQIWASREATRIIYERNGVKEWIWWSALDGRTCLGCIAMHGTKHPVSDVLNDHHQGRCTMVPVTPTWSELGFEGEEPNYLTGPEWLARQPEEVQRGIFNSVGLYEDWVAGRVSLTPDVVSVEYDDPIYGVMRRRASDKEIMG